MHNATGYSLRIPTSILPVEFIPTVYDLTLVAESGDNYSLEAVGRFASPELFKPIIA